MMRGCSAVAAGAWLGGCVSGPGGGAVEEEAGPAPGEVQAQPLPSGPLRAATLAVSGRRVGRIDPGFAGLSYEKSALALPCFTPDNLPLIGMFRGLGVSLLRIGGNSVDGVHWNPDGRGRTAGEVAPADIDALAGFLRRCGWRALYGVNLATSTPGAAAREVAYASQSLGEYLYGIEIGNEPDLYGGNYFPHWSLADFEQRWGEFRRAILASVPQVVLTGPADSYNVESWTLPFGRHAGKEQIALLTQHYYRGNGRSPLATTARLLSPDETLVSGLGKLRDGAAGIGVPFRLTETNSFFNGGASGVSNSYASALWVIDHLCNTALGGAVGVNLHGGGAGEGYTPIADRHGVVLEARPEYYGVRLFTLAGHGALLANTLSAGSLHATAYAVERTDGSLSLLIVNKDPTQNLSLVVDCPRPVPSATLIALSGPALTATGGVRIQGAAIALDGSLTEEVPFSLPTSGSQMGCYVAAQSAVLLRVSPPLG